ncbi:MAG: ParB/RepB/Spo0J family partition protein [Pseudomonas aeruginosa]|nr:ParB/RepB/Spo0J family partition protein [Brucella anthropi]
MTVPYEFKRIPLYLVDVPEGRIRRQRAERVETLAKDIAAQGQLQPIVVVETEDGRFSLDDGALRVAALRQNKVNEIDARVTPISWLRPQERRLREIMINLNREPYTALEEGEALAELKEVYEALYPDTRKGVAGGKARQKSATEIFSFAAAAAEATGLSDRAIRMAVAMVNGLSEDTKQRVRGTSVERKALDLRNLAVMPHELQSKALDLLFSEPPQAGSVAEALVLAEGRKPENPVEKAFRSFSDTWTRFEVRYRRNFIRAHKDEILSILAEEGAL